MTTDTQPMTCIGRFRHKIETVGSAPVGDIGDWCDHCQHLWRSATNIGAGFGQMPIGEFKRRFPCLRMRE